MQNEHFYKLRQNQVFNDNLICYGTRKTNEKNVDNEIILHSPNKEFLLMLSENNCVKSSNLIFLTMVLSKMTEKGIKRYYDEEFTMTLKEYTNYRQISANKARDKIKEDLKVLFDMCIRINTKNSQTDFRIISVKSVIKNNTIKIWFTKKFLDYYSSIQYFMNLPKELFRIDVRYHPNTFGMLWKLLYHYNINENKGNKSSDCLSVIKLLEYCPTIPHYDDKLKAQGGLNQRIIQPFIRDLNAIDIIDWYFLDEQNNIVAKDCIKTYADFELLKIKFKWTNGYMVEKSKNKDLSLM